MSSSGSEWRTFLVLTPVFAASMSLKADREATVEPMSSWLSTSKLKQGAISWGPISRKLVLSVGVTGGLCCTDCIDCHKCVWVCDSKHVNQYKMTLHTVGNVLSTALFTTIVKDLCYGHTIKGAVRLKMAWYHVKWVTATAGSTSALSNSVSWFSSTRFSNCRIFNWGEH